MTQSGGDNACRWQDLPSVCSQGNTTKSKPGGKQCRGQNDPQKLAGHVLLELRRKSHSRDGFCDAITGKWTKLNSWYPDYVGSKGYRQVHHTWGRRSRLGPRSRDVRKKPPWKERSRFIWQSSIWESKGWPSWKWMSRGKQITWDSSHHVQHIL